MTEHKTFRAKAHNLSMGEASPFAQAYSYRADHPVKDMLAPEYFLPCRSMLRAGDTIKMAWMKDGRVREMAEIMVVEVHKDAIEFYVLRDIVSFDAEKAKAKPAPGPDEIYVDGDGYQVKHKGRGKWAVLDPEGNEVAGGLEEADARAIRAGAQPIPQAA